MFALFIIGHRDPLGGNQRVRYYAYTVENVYGGWLDVLSALKQTLHVLNSVYKALSHASHAVFEIRIEW